MNSTLKYDTARATFEYWLWPAVLGERMLTATSGRSPHESYPLPLRSFSSFISSGMNFLGAIQCERWITRYELRVVRLSSYLFRDSIYTTLDISINNLNSARVRCYICLHGDARGSLKPRPKSSRCAGHPVTPRWVRVAYFAQ